MVEPGCLAQDTYIMELLLLEVSDFAAFMPLISSVVATVKTGQWNGVVTAFITMSDIKGIVMSFVRLDQRSLMIIHVADEIDWEFPGAATTEGQTNYFWQGVIRWSTSLVSPLSY